MSKGSSIEVKGAPLWGWQNDFVRLFKSLGPDEVIVLKKCRQVGASFTIAQILFYVAINRPKSTSIYITTTNSAARKQFSDMVTMAVGADRFVTANASTLELHFINGSVVYFRSSESQLRGLSCRNGGILCADEVAFLNRDVWTQILPFVTVSHANMIIVSTPWARRGMYYTFYTRALMGDPGFHLIDVTDYDLSQFITSEQRQVYKSILSPQAYRTEIEGEFLDGGSGVFGSIDSLISAPHNDDIVYAGIDFAVSVGGDDCCLVGFNELKEQTFIWTDNETKDPLDRVDAIVRILNSHPECKRVVCETNSMGSTFISAMRRGLDNPSIIREFTTSNSSKCRVIEDLIAIMGRKEITLLDDEKQAYELDIYQYEALGSGRHTYNADPRADNSHDDIVMALAFAVHAFSSGPRYLVT